MIPYKMPAALFCGECVMWKIFFIGFICVFFIFGCGDNYSDILVTKVIEGDPLRLSNGKRVGLIGIDCPEAAEGKKLYEDAKRTSFSIATMQAMGISSQEFTKGLVERKRVRLEFDVQKKDKTGKLLAYIFFKDGTFLNGEILKQGYGFYVPDTINRKYHQRLQSLFQEAREERRGLFATADIPQW